MSKRVLTILIILGLVLSLAIGGIYAYGGGNDKPKGDGLNLTEEQKEKIKGIMEDLREKEKEVFEKIKEVRDKERSVLDASPLNEDELSSLVDENISYIGEIMDLREEAFVEIEKVLTGEQREKYLTSFAFLSGRFIKRRKPKNRFEEETQRTIRDWLFLAKKLNLTEEQKGILNELIGKLRAKAIIHDAKKRIGALIKRLNLTDEQRESFLSILKDERESEKEILSNIRELMESEKEIVKNEPLDETSLRNSIEEVKGKLNEVLSLRKEMYLNIVNLLTDEQRKNLPTSIPFLSPGVVR